jgi:hypothetical protein
MAKTMFKKVVWLGRASTFCVGLAVILALSVGLASAALAGTGVGAPFNLGKTNTVDALSSLVGRTSSSMLKVDNNGSGTALDLRVGPSTTPPEQKAAVPMKVDSQAKVANLTADKVDGVDMPLSGDTFVDPPNVGAHSCLQSSVTIPGKQASDSGLLFPSRNFTVGVSGANVTLVTHAGVGVDSADKLFYTMCNVGDSATDPPGGFWSYVIVRV